MKRRRVQDSVSEERGGVVDVNVETTESGSESTVHVLSDDLLVQRAREDMEKQQLLMRCHELEKKVQQLTNEKEKLQKCMMT